jgi:ParB-like chromosome segregation protein Spo0J
MKEKKMTNLLNFTKGLFLKNETKNEKTQTQTSKTKKDDGQHISTIDKAVVMLNPEIIQTHPDISSLFPIDEKTVKKIKVSMKDGYDKSQPIVVWNSNGSNVLVDGHQRTQAAKEVGLKEIPAYIFEFIDLEEAIHYTFKRQAERRNLTDAEILQAVTLLSNKTTRDGKGRSIEKLSEEYGVSASKLTQARTVSKRAQKEVIEDIKKGKVSLNKAYRDVKESKQVDDESIKTEKHSILTTEDKEPIIIKQDEHFENDYFKNDEYISESPKIEEVDIKQSITNSNGEFKNEEQQINDLTTVCTEDIIRLLADNKEFGAIKVILNRYNNLVSRDFLSGLGL